MNNKLALKDEILLTIDKPARYIGNEVNMVRKNPKEVKIRVAFAFPDVYEIGMSHLGIQILYHQFNLREDVYCERVYSPWPDLHKIMNCLLYTSKSWDADKITQKIQSTIDVSGMIEQLKELP